MRFELGRGELVGELSFLNGLELGNSSANDATDPSSIHSSSALCTKDAELIKISRPCFENLIRQHPRVMLKISQILANRLNDVMNSNSSNGGASSKAATNSSDGERRSSILSHVPRSPFVQARSTSAGKETSSVSCMSVCILSSSPHVDLQNFALTLSLSLAAFGRTMLLTPAHCDRVLGEGTTANLNSYYHRSLFTYWLSHVESEYSFCLFVADGAITPWTMTCQRQADLTLIVANAEDDPEDDFSSDDDEFVAELLKPVKRRSLKRRMRIKRVTPFEKLCAWNGGQRVINQQLQKQRHRQQQPPQTPDASSTPTSTNDPDSFRIQQPSFSPTLHPTPEPTSATEALNTSGNSSSASKGRSTTSTTTSSSTCYPRLHFSLRDLILLHPPGSQPHGTRYWCGLRPSLHRYHHLTIGCQEHADRLARYIAGKSVGVVLSGGGARGLSHLGVLTSFAEQNVPIDYIGGTSQGSFMAALYAGQPYHHLIALQQMKMRVHTLAEKMGSIASLLSDATFPLMSYFAGKKFGANIASILGEHTRIEDLYLPYYCVTTNLSQADMCVHDRGVLWKAVRASMTVSRIKKWTQYGKDTHMLCADERVLFIICCISLLYSALSTRFLIIFLQCKSTVHGRTC